MTDTRRKRQDGIRTLAGIKGRCVIEAETGCWLWRGAFSCKASGRGQPTSRVWIPGWQAKSGTTTTAPRAAWLLAGNDLPPNGVVWRHVCRNSECINPKHGKGGTRAQMFEAFVADGRMRGDPKRAAVNAQNRRSQLVSVERVREAEAMFAAGALQKDVCAALSLGNAAAAKIRKGQHPNSSGARATIPAASVFGWRGQIAVNDDEAKAA